MTVAYPLVFSPFALADDIRLKNRILFTAMGVDLADPDGSATAELADFYTGVAKGGAGAVVLGNSSVSSASRLHPRGLVLENTRQRDSLKRLIESCGEHECPTIVQLQHYGPKGAAPDAGGALLSPSPLPAGERQNAPVRVMDRDDIAAVVAHFARAAGLAEAAGARVVQLQASNGYLISRFLTPHFNCRDDEYGGDIEGRSRLLCEIVEAIRAEVQGRLIVTVRLNVNDMIDSGGLSTSDVLAVIDRLTRLGVSMVELSACVHSSFSYLLAPEPVFIVRFRQEIAAVRAQAAIPVAFAGGTPDMATANDLLRTGICDMVGMSRALFADNDLVKKAASGDEAAIRQCLFDGNCFRDKSNPLADRVYCCVSEKYPRPKHICYS